MFDSTTTQYPPPLFQSGTTARSSEVRPSLQTLQAENERLQASVSELTEKLNNAQEIIRKKEEQEQAVRDSMMLVRREVSALTCQHFHEAHEPWACLITSALVFFCVYLTGATCHGSLNISRAN
jgi:regulator of replication initiation timing